jgi:hypothetical protein
MKFRRHGVCPHYTNIMASAAGSNLNIGLAQLALKQTVIDKFLYLSTIRKNNVHLFYRLVTDHLKV